MSADNIAFTANLARKRTKAPITALVTRAFVVNQEKKLGQYRSFCSLPPVFYTVSASLLNPRSYFFSHLLWNLSPFHR